MKPTNSHKKSNDAAFAIPSLEHFSFGDIGERAPSMAPQAKYQALPTAFRAKLANRRWPHHIITEAPRWCSVDLRDGNQALINPMNIQQKMRMFAMLAHIGFPEIEIGFPSSNDTEYRFARLLIENNLIPGWITPQVLVQAKAQLIEKTFAALEGAKQAIVHVYNSTSEQQRRIVFGQERPKIVEIATTAVQQIKELAAKAKGAITLEYSPESFTLTEPEFALEICSAVCEVWQPSELRKIIINLPATVEVASPNVYADQVEWFIENFAWRDQTIISVHPHNDRGTAVAAAELALLAGADRVEGTLFGNGERTGNVDIVTLALNLFTDGIDPNLDLRKVRKIREVAEDCTQLPVHPRHPYAGDLVFTAFSGSHQDAIGKGMKLRDGLGSSAPWDVPYIPIDPRDIGRDDNDIVRVNSQSGKGGAAFILRTKFGCDLPKAMQVEFGNAVKQLCDDSGTEISPNDIWECFEREYLNRKRPFELISFVGAHSVGQGSFPCSMEVKINGQTQHVTGDGVGPVDACKNGLIKLGAIPFEIVHQSSASRTQGAAAEAVNYMVIELANGQRIFGAGISRDSEMAMIQALISAVNRNEEAQALERAKDLSLPPDQAANAG